MSSFSSDKYQFLLTSTRPGRTTTSSNAQKNPAQKSQHRPPPLTRPSAGSSTVRLSKTGLPSPSTKRKGKTEEEKFDMATGFLPFCAMCEKQIMTPHSSVLYCSQSCQNQDSSKPLSASSVSLSPAPTPPSSPVFSRSIVPRLEPTKLPPSTSPTSATATAKASSPRIPDHTYDVTSDVDPSEWNPLRRHSEFADHNDPVGRFGYLSPAHRRAHSVPNNRHNRNTSVASLSHHVPSLSSSPSSSPTPSPSPSPTLTHATPTTVAQEETENHGQDSTSKHYRPLPPLHKPSLSAGGSTKRGVELVMPQAAVRLVV